MKPYIQHKNKCFLCIILLYGLIIIAWNLNYSSASHDEALNILMGRYVLKEYTDPHIFNVKLPNEMELGIEQGMIPQHTGSVMIQPVFAALGDYVGGLPGARSVGIFFGLGLTVIIYRIASILFSKNNGLIAAILLLSSGTLVYLSKLATYDIVSVFFLGLSFLLILISEKHPSFSRSGIWLLLGATSLFLSAITKYVAAIYILPFLIYVFWRHKFSNALLFFLVPLTFYIFIYVNLALIPAWGHLAGSTTGLYKEGKTVISVLTERLYQWLAFPYLLAGFGIFNKNFRRSSIISLIILSTPIVLLHLLSGDGRSLNKNVIYSIIFLIPAAAIGVDKMASIFSMNTHSTWVKPFFMSAVLIIVWVFGIQELRWLERQFPNLSPVIRFLAKEGFNGMTVVIDSKYGDPQYMYYYSIEDVYPKARFSSMSRLDNKEKEDLLTREKPDFLILDEFYGGKYLSYAALQLVRQGYASVGNFDLPLSWGIQKVRIFKQREPVPVSKSPELKKEE